MYGHSHSVNTSSTSNIYFAQTKTHICSPARELHHNTIAFIIFNILENPGILIVKQGMRWQFRRNSVVFRPHQNPIWSWWFLPIHPFHHAALYDNKCSNLWKRYYHYSLLSICLRTLFCYVKHVTTGEECGDDFLVFTRVSVSYSLRSCFHHVHVRSTTFSALPIQPLQNYQLCGDCSIRTECRTHILKTLKHAPFNEFESSSRPNKFHSAVSL